MKTVKDFLFEKYKAWGWTTSILLFLPLIPSIGNTILKDIFIGFGVTLFTSWVILNSFNKEFLELFIYETLPFRDQIKLFGLKGIAETNNTKELGIDLIDTDKLIIAMNDSKNFSTNNSYQLSERYKRRNKKTIFILLNPECADILCKLNGKESVDFYKGKIKDVISSLQEAKKSGANIEIYLTDNIFRTSVVLTDTIAMVGTYRNSKGKENIPPIYLYSSNGKEYECIERDISKLISPPKKI